MKNNRISSIARSRLLRNSLLATFFLVCVALVGSGSRVSAQSYTTAFQSSGGYFMVAEDGGGNVLNCDRTAIGPWETFTLIDLNGGSLESGDLVNIQSVGGYFVVAEGGGGDVVNCDRTVAQSWETFLIEKVGGSGVIAGAILFRYKLPTAGLEAVEITLSLKMAAAALSTPTVRRSDHGKLSPSTSFRSS